MKIQEFANRFKEIKGISFINISNYKNSKGEIENVLININIDYNKTKLKDIETLRNIDLNSIDFNDKILLEQAKNELINSFINPNKTQSDAQNNTYTHLANNVKIHNETNEIYVTGTKVRKTITQIGEYKEVKSKPLTVAKNILRSYLQTSKIR